jgi:O-antigen/teichoic acid export membrane protein
MAGWPGGLSAILSLFTLIGLSLLYRELPVREAGLLALVLAFSDILSLVALLGLGTVITRLYAASQPGTYDWAMDLVGAFVYALPIVVLGSVAILVIYGFSVAVGLYLLVLATLGTLLAAAYSMLNSQGRYAWSAFLVRAPNAALLLPGFVGLLALGKLRLSDVLAVYLFATALALALALLLLLRVLPRGRLRTSRKQRLQGLAFMATASTDLLSDQGLVAVAGKILPLNQVAAFAAVALLIRPFRLLRSVLAMILAPDLVRFRRFSYRRLLAGVWVLALACGLAAAILAPPIASRFYGGRYQEAMSWIPYLSLAGALLIGVVPPRADLGVRAPIRIVNRFALTYLLSMVGALAASIAGMYAWGAVFLGFAVVLLQLTETGVAYAFWLGFRRSEDDFTAR